MNEVYHFDTHVQKRYSRNATGELESSLITSIPTRLCSTEVWLFGFGRRVPLVFRLRRKALLFSDFRIHS